MLATDVFVPPTSTPMSSLASVMASKLSAALTALVKVLVRSRRDVSCAAGVYPGWVTERPSTTPPDRNLALELVRVTEAAALGASRLIGRGDKEAADQAAVDAMRHMLDSVHMDGVVVIGEGEKDEAPMLFNGERIGDGSAPHVDIAVDPLEGTTLTARGMPSALSVIALSPRGTMFDPGPCVYMEKIAGGAEIVDLLDLDRPIGETLALVAKRKGIAVADVMVVMLDRPRHADALTAIHAAGARVRLISDGDVSASLLACGEGGPVDLLWGIGGTPEGVLSAAAIKCIGGQLFGRLWPRDDRERQAAIDAGYDLSQVLGCDDLVAGDDCFFSATGVTDGDVLQGVRYQGSTGATTESLVMRSRSGTVRRIHARHDRAKLRSY
jgi:fructose-1,6-bisphosphatase II